MAQHPGHETTQHDLDPNAEGDLVVETAVGQLQSVMIAVNSTSGENVSASVRWISGDGTAYQSESAADIALSGVTNDWARLVRKGPLLEVTVSSEAVAGTQNLVNLYVDGHR